MTHEEHHDIIQILTTETWAVRPKLLEYMRTVTVEEPPTVEEIMVPEDNLGNNGRSELEPQDPPSEPEDWVKVQEQYLSGHNKPEYPEYSGPPTI